MGLEGAYVIECEDYKAGNIYCFLKNFHAFSDKCGNIYCFLNSVFVKGGEIERLPYVASNSGVIWYHVSRNFQA